jgi:hypothetical protein
MPTKITWIAAISIIWVLAACGGGANETDIAAIPTLAELPTETPPPTATDTPVLTDTPTATSMPTNTATATPTASPTATPTATEDTEATVYFATQNYLATIDAENAIAIAALDAAGLLPTSTPTEPPIEPLEAESIFFTQDGGVRVRACQYISEACQDVVPELAENVAVTVVATTTGDTFRGSNQWYQVNIDGTLGFIHATLLAATPPLPTLIPADITLTAASVQSLAVATPEGEG